MPRLCAGIHLRPPRCRGDGSARYFSSNHPPTSSAIWTSETSASFTPQRGSVTCQRCASQRSTIGCRRTRPKTLPRPTRTSAVNTPRPRTADGSCHVRSQPAAAQIQGDRKQHERRVPDAEATDRHLHGRRRSHDAAANRQARLKTSVPLVPPNPKLFFTANSIRISRAVLAQ